jgi:hypothetical protein
MKKSPILASSVRPKLSEDAFATSVLTVTVKAAFVAEDRLRDDGEIVHVAFMGTPVQESVAVPAAPGVAAIDKL